MRRIAVVGDQLDAGGQIEPYTGSICAWGDGGHQAALIGGNAYCEACQSVGTIAKSGGPRRINFFIGEIALDGDIVLCNCATPTRIVARRAGEAWHDDMAEAATASASKKTSNVSHSSTETYDEQFTLADANGTALPQTYYTIRMPSGELVHGITDSSGKTAHYETSGAQRLRIYLGHREG